MAEFVDESIDMLEMICDKGSELLIERNKAGEEEIIKSEEDPIIDIPIAVLVNGSSASASEIFCRNIKRL